MAIAGNRYIIIVNLFRALSFLNHEVEHLSALHTGGSLSNGTGFQQIEQCLWGEILTSSLIFIFLEALFLASLAVLCAALKIVSLRLKKSPTYYCAFKITSFH
jgi:hypothetical protein